MFKLVHILQNCHEVTGDAARNPLVHRRRKVTLRLKHLAVILWMSRRIVLDLPREIAHVHSESVRPLQHRRNPDRSPAQPLRLMRTTLVPYFPDHARIEDDLTGDRTPGAEGRAFKRRPIVEFQNGPHRGLLSAEATGISASLTFMALPSGSHIQQALARPRVPSVDPHLVL